MLLTPEAHPFDLKKPPRLVLALCLLLAGLYLLWSQADTTRQASLDSLYEQELLPIEWPLYETHLLKARQSALLLTLQRHAEQQEFMPLARQLGSDRHFAADLAASGHEYLDGDTYARWQRARQAYDTDYRKLSRVALGLDARQFRPITFITYQLAETSWLSLAGHLLLLLSAGLALELALGGMAVLLAFVLGGLAGAVAFLLFNSQSVIPWAGAGPGIAAIVAMFTLHFRQQKLLLAGKVAVTPWIIPGLWLVLVALEFLLVDDNLRRLLPQLAGLLMGPAALLMHERWLKADTSRVVEKESVDTDLLYREQLDKALQAVGRMEFVDAKKRLRELVKAYPQDLRVLEQLYKVEKLEPASDTYEAVARRLFTLSNTDEAAQVCLAIYRDYSKLSHSSRALDSDTSLKLVMRFARLGEVKEAEKLMKSVLDKGGKHALLPKAAHALSQAYDRLQDGGRAEFYRELASGA